MWSHRAYLEQVEFVGRRLLDSLDASRNWRPSLTMPKTTFRSIQACWPGDSPSHPALAGRDVRPAAERLWTRPTATDCDRTFLDLIREHSAKVDGVKVSLPPPTTSRSCVPPCPGCSAYTGDDFNYPELIEGDGASLRRPARCIRRDRAAASAAPSARWMPTTSTDIAGRYPDAAAVLGIFAGTTYYKTGIAFLAWLNGHRTVLSWWAVCSPLARSFT